MESGRKRLFYCLFSIFIMLIAGAPMGKEAGAQSESLITVAAVGDIMMGTDWPKKLLPPDDGRDIFSSVRDDLRGHDIVMGNLEGPLTECVEQKKCRDGNENCFAFRTPPHYAGHLVEAGFNVMNVANNHSGDFGEDGLKDTLRVLEDAGIQPVGGRLIARFLLKGRRVAIAGFSYMPLSFYSYPINDIRGAAQTVRALKDSNDIVIVTFHGGAEGRTALHVEDREEEFLGEKRGNVKKFARAMIDNGADLVIGHGPHVLRAMEVYRGKLIAYSLGNFLVYERFSIDGESGISMILTVKMDPRTGDFAGGRLIPVRIVGAGIPVKDRRARAVELVRKLTAEDLGAAGLRIDDSGTVERTGSPE